MVKNLPHAIKMSVQATLSEREGVLASLQGQKIVVPGINTLFKSWPSSWNPHYPLLTDAVDGFLESLPFSSRKIVKLKSADFALFASAWWPHAPYEELFTSARLIIWLFVWDDELDQPTGSLTDDVKTANEYRRQTVKYVEQSLGIRDHHLRRDSLNPLISSFETIAVELRNKYSLAQRRRMRDEIKAFVKSTKPEQLTKLNDKIWALDEYWENRLGTSAVGVTSAIIEHTTRAPLPRHVQNRPEMKVIWHETNMIVSIVNDLLSVKKELALGCVDSYIPLACATGLSAQQAVDEAVRDVGVRIRRFDKAATALLQSCSAKPRDVVQHSHHFAQHVGLRRTSRASMRARQTRALVLKDAVARQSPATYKALQKFIQTSRQNCVGNMAWSLTTSRYGLKDCPRDDGGAIHIQL